MRIILEEIRKNLINQNLTDIRYKDNIFKVLRQEVNDRLDDDYINRMSANPNFKQKEHKVIMRFLFELAEAVDNRFMHDEDYKIGVINEA